MEKNKERIRSIPGFDNRYYVSDFGRVFSAFYKRELSTECNRSGYKRVWLRVDGEYKRKSVHRLVALAFIGEPPLGHVVNHKDGNRTNNRLENLEYITVSENVIHGRLLRNGNLGVKLTPEKVDEIRSLRGAVTLRELAKRYGVSFQMISLIQNGKCWV